MCGIFLYLNNGERFDISRIVQEFMKIQHRGPDCSQVFIEKNLVVGFHRLAINDLSYKGNQPMFMHDTMLVCNGEIYNFKELIEEFDLKCQSYSDCETIIKLYSHLYEVHKGDIEATIHQLCNCLDGEFAFILYDRKNNKIIAARDHVGIRSCYLGFDENNKKIAIASELKAIDQLIDNVEQFRPSSYMILDIETFKLKINKYNNISEPYIPDKMETDLDVILPKIRELLIKAVEKRVSGTLDVPFCCTLSGGLDSSLICSIISKWFLKEGEHLNTFTVGIQGSSLATDLKYARILADYIKSNHTEVIVSRQQMLDAIDEVIRLTETWDVTTIRASCGHYLISKYIKENTNFTVCISGEIADEVESGYIYFKKSPSPNDLHNETNRLLENVCYFDSLRADRCVSGNGLEVRCPYSCRIFCKFIQSIDPKLRMCNDKIEKFLIRKAFENDINFIPYDILYRGKETFSDGVTSNDESWYQIIQNHISTLLSDDEFIKESEKYKDNCKPHSKEALYYRQIFDKYYKNGNIIPHYWKSTWCETNEPSARSLKDIFVPSE